MKTVAEMIKEMFTIQNGLNTKSYDSAWIEKGKTEEFDYAMAAGDEAHEFARSLPFEWWKKNAPDRQNQVTEIVDAWHFVMSQIIIDNGGDVESAIDYTLSFYKNAMANSDDLEDTVQKQLKLFVGSIYLENSRHASQLPFTYEECFFMLCSKAEISLELLYARYIAKAELNKFRVENGYKVGKYHKMWRLDGDTENHEDNYYLSKWVDWCIKSGQAPTSEHVANWLKSEYTRMLAETAPAV